MFNTNTALPKFFSGHHKQKYQDFVDLKKNQQHYIMFAIKSVK